LAEPSPPTHTELGVIVFFRENIRQARSGILPHSDAPHALSSVSFLACIVARLRSLIQESLSENSPALSLILIVASVRIDLRLGPQRTTAYPSPGAAEGVMQDKVIQDQAIVGAERLARHLGRQNAQDGKSLWRR